MSTILYVGIGLVVVWLLFEITGINAAIWGVRTYRDGLKERRKRNGEQD